MVIKFSEQSENNLVGVWPPLVRVTRRALSYGIAGFSVREGVRKIERQKRLYDEGATQTLNSMHLIQPDGYGHAVDLYPSPIDMVRVNKNDAREIARFGVIAGLMLRAAQEEDVKILWGGDWDRDGQTLDHSFFDAPHFQTIP